MKGQEDLTHYLFNTRKNHQYFCRHCGVRAFGVDKETPIGKMYGVRFYALQDEINLDVKMLEYARSRPTEFYFTGVVERAVPDGPLRQ